MSVRRALTWLATAGVFTGLVVVAVVVQIGSWGSGREISEIFTFLLLLGVAQAGTVLITLRVYRAIGFRFVRSPRAGPGVSDTLVDGRPPGR